MKKYPILLSDADVIGLIPIPVTVDDLVRWEKNKCFIRSIRLVNRKGPRRWNLRDLRVWLRENFAETMPVQLALVNAEMARIERANSFEVA